MKCQGYFMTSRDDYLRCRVGLPSYLTKSYTGALTQAPGGSSVGDANDNRRRWRNS